jgi:hypothetical protein
MMLNDGRIKFMHLWKQLGKNISKLLEKGFVRRNLFKRTICPKRDILLNTKYNQDIHLDGR